MMGCIPKIFRTKKVRWETAETVKSTRAPIDRFPFMSLFDEDPTDPRKTPRALANIRDRIYKYYWTGGRVVLNAGLSEESREDRICPHDKPFGVDTLVSVDGWTVCQKSMACDFAMALVCRDISADYLTFFWYMTPLEVRLVLQERHWDEKRRGVDEEETLAFLRECLPPTILYLTSWIQINIEALHPLEWIDKYWTNWLLTEMYLMLSDCRDDAMLTIGIRFPGQTVDRDYLHSLALPFWPLVEQKGMFLSEIIGRTSWPLEGRWMRSCEREFEARVSDGVSNEGSEKAVEGFEDES